MTGAQRLQVAEQLYWSARKMKLAGLRSQHPDWTERHLEEEVRRIFITASGFVSESQPLPEVFKPVKTSPPSENLPAPGP